MCIPYPRSEEQVPNLPRLVFASWLNQLSGERCVNSCWNTIGWKTPTSKIVELAIPRCESPRLIGLVRIPCNHPCQRSQIESDFTSVYSLWKCCGESFGSSRWKVSIKFVARCTVALVPWNSATIVQNSIESLFNHSGNNNCLDDFRYCFLSREKVYLDMKGCIKLTYFYLLWNWPWAAELTCAGANPSLFDRLVELVRIEKLCT